jgi:hypothetical protein
VSVPGGVDTAVRKAGPRTSQEQFAIRHDWLWNRGVVSEGHVSLCRPDFVLKRSNLAQTRFSKGESPHNLVPALAVEQAEFVPPDSVRRRCEVSGCYGSSVRRKADGLEMLRHRDHALVVGPLPHDKAISKPSPHERGDRRLGYRLQGNMRRGTASSLSGTWSPYATLEQAREAAREMLKDDRVLRITIVEDALPPRFVEWVNR